MYIDWSFYIDNASMYFVKYPSRAAQNSLEGRMRPAGRGLKAPVVRHKVYKNIKLKNQTKQPFLLKVKYKEQRS